MPEISPGLYRAGSGEPVVLLHGFTGTWHHWRPLLGELAARYEVIAPTLAGHAGGPAPEAGMTSLAAAADSLEAHLSDLGVGTAHFVGNSLGGALGLELAKRGRARSLVALAPGRGVDPRRRRGQAAGAILLPPDSLDEGHRAADRPDSSKPEHAPPRAAGRDAAR